MPGDVGGCRHDPQFVAVNEIRRVSRVERLGDKCRDGAGYGSTTRQGNLNKKRGGQSSCQPFRNRCWRRRNRSGLACPDCGRCGPTSHDSENHEDEDGGKGLAAHLRDASLGARLASSDISVCSVRS
jgi:hypothetical protein